MHAPIDLRRLEELGLNSSAPPGQLLHDGWLVRLQPGKAKRARSVNALYPSTRPLAAKIRHCEALFAARGLPTLFRITPFSEPPELDATLASLGYPRFDTTAVETAPLEQPPGGAADGTQPLALAPWVEAVGALRGSPAAHRAGHLERLSCHPLAQQPLVVRAGGAIVATGLTIVEDGWAGLFDIVTAPGQRRQGHGRRIVEGLLRAAHALGARQAYLQVDADNTAARRLYADYGFAERYRYWYRGHEH